MPKVFIQTLEVGEASIDLNQHVNNQEYLRWAQEVAIAHCVAQNCSMEQVMATGASWYAKSHYIEYLRPALLGDRLLVATWLATLTDRACTRLTRFFRRDDLKLVARVSTEWAFVSLASQRPIRIPPEVQGAFEPVAEAEALAQIRAFAGESLLDQAQASRSV